MIIVRFLCVRLLMIERVGERGGLSKNCFCVIIRCL